MYSEKTILMYLKTKFFKKKQKTLNSNIVKNTNH